MNCLYKIHMNGSLGNTLLYFSNSNNKYIARNLLEDILLFTFSVVRCSAFTFSSEMFLQFAKTVEFFRIFFLVVSRILILPQKTSKKIFHDPGSKCHTCTTPGVWGSIPME